MEGVMKQWEEAEAEAEVEEVAPLRRQLQVTTTITASSDTQAPQHNGVSGVKNAGMEFSQTEATSSDIEEKITLHPPEPVISVVSASPINVTTVSERVGIITENVGELYLESVYQKLPTQGFYCPHCKTCIEKVLIQDTIVKGPSLDDTLRCTSCFSFLIPIGTLLGFAKAGKGSPRGGGLGDEIPKPAPRKKVPAPDPGTSELRPKTPEQESLVTSIEPGTATKSGRDTSLDIKVDKGIAEPAATPTVDATPQPKAVQGPESSKTFEILKSIVYGGLIEYITSLSIVTSAASADASTLSILALALANLIGGLFVLVHHIWDLKSEQQSTNNQTNALVDRYYQLLGKGENFFLHLPIAILSFLIFGLVPPLVYAFAFYGSNDMDLKLAAVAGASVLCITLLSIAKAYIQRPPKYQTYLKTVLYYLTTGALASVVAYLAGELIRKLLEKLGWFDSASSSFTMLLPEMSMGKPRFGSY